jgi:hypothetical protein
VLSLLPEETLPLSGPLWPLASVVVVLSVVQSVRLLLSVVLSVVQSVRLLLSVVLSVVLSARLLLSEPWRMSLLCPPLTCSDGCRTPSPSHAAAE